MINKIIKEKVISIVLAVVATISVGTFCMSSASAVVCRHSINSTVNNTSETSLSADELEIFEYAVGEMKDVSYIPISVETQQVETGKVYKFFCNAETINMKRTSYNATVTIHQDFAGNTKLSSIERL